jgi:F0F1-type ATP synthase assembly protein I
LAFVGSKPCSFFDFTSIDLFAPVSDRPEDRSTLAQAVAWSSRITTVALEMALPGALGYWIDQKLGTRFLFLILGMGAGMTAGLIHLLRMVASPLPNHDRPDKDTENYPGNQT